MDKAQIEYVKSQLAAGHSPDDVKAVMRQHGYDDALIDQLFAAATTEGEEMTNAQTQTTNQAASDVSSDTQAFNTATTSQSGSTLIGYGAMLSQGWKLALGNLGLIGGGILAMLLLVVLSFVALFVIGMGTFTSVVAGGGGAGLGITIMITALVFYIFAYVYGSAVGLAVMRGLLFRDTEPGFWHNFGAAWGYVLSLILITVYTQLLTSLGMVLLIIPGVALAIYLSMTPLVLVGEGRRGFAALVRSIDLVYGRWWSVLGRFLLSGFAAGVVYILGAMLAGVLAASMGEAIGIAFFFLLIPIFVLLGFWIVGNMVVVFESLQRVAPAAAFDAKDHSSIKMWMRIAVIAGLLIPLASLALLAATTLSSLNSARDWGQDASVMSNLSTLRSQAEIFASKPNGETSYVGLCDATEVQSTLDTLEDRTDVECAAGNEWYVIQAQLNSGEWYCVDSSGNAENITDVRRGEQSCIDSPMSEMRESMDRRLDSSEQEDEIEIMNTTSDQTNGGVQNQPATNTSVASPVNERDGSRSNVVSGDALDLILEDTAYYDAFGGSGFFDDESVLILPVRIQNPSTEIQTFTVADVRLRGANGRLFMPLSESSVANQPRFASRLSASAVGLTELRNETVLPNEEIYGVLVFYINTSSKPNTYVISVPGGVPLQFSVPNTPLDS